MKRIYYLLIAIVLCVSCSTGMNVSGGAPARFNLVLLDDLAKSFVSYINHRHGVLPSGQVDVVAVLGNKHKERELAIDWKVFFYDKDGFEVEQTEWNTNLLLPSQTITLQTRSIGINVYGYAFHVRSAQN